MSKKYIPSAKRFYTKDLSNINLNFLSENSPNILSHFGNHKLFSTTKPLCTFLAQTLHTFQKSSPSKCKLSEFSLLRLKYTKFLMSFLKEKISFSSKFASFFKCHEKKFFCTLLAGTLYAIDKRNMSKYKFSDLPLLALKFIKVLMLFLESRISFSSNLVSIFSIMRHNSS